jgi:DNA primase
MLDILAVLPGKKKHTQSGWYAFNGICCHNRGHNIDRRGRAGIKFTGETNWNYHCFNCQFKCGMTLGKHFSRNLKQLLQWCGLDSQEIDRMSFESFSQRSLLDMVRATPENTEIKFLGIKLPPGARQITNDPADKFHQDYLASRGFTVDDYKFFTVDDEARPRIILPYFYEGRIVGNTSRFYDGRRPKYLSEQQKGYVFNIDAQHADWSVCILTEGQFDALSIGGCAYMGSNISDDQARLLSKLRRRIIVVPDQDEAGLEICDRTLELGYQVSIPNWGDEIKDVNDAVVKYGRLPTLLSILQCATSSKIKIGMARKRFK